MKRTLHLPLIAAVLSSVAVCGTFADELVKPRIVGYKIEEEKEGNAIQVIFQIYESSETITFVHGSSRLYSEEDVFAVDDLGPFTGSRERSVIELNRYKGILESVDISGNQIEVKYSSLVRQSASLISIPHAHEVGTVCSIGEDLFVSIRIWSGLDFRSDLVERNAADFSGFLKIEIPKYVVTEDGKDFEESGSFRFTTPRLSFEENGKISIDLNSLHNE